MHDYYLTLIGPWTFARSGGHPVPQNLGHEASDLSNVEICQTGRDAFLTPHIPQIPMCNVGDVIAEGPTRRPRRLPRIPELVASSERLAYCLAYFTRPCSHSPKP